MQRVSHIFILLTFLLGVGVGSQGAMLLCHEVNGTAALEPVAGHCCGEVSEKVKPAGCAARGAANEPSDEGCAICQGRLVDVDGQSAVRARVDVDTLNPLAVLPLVVACLWDFVGVDESGGFGRERALILPAYAAHFVVANTVRNC